MSVAVSFRGPVFAYIEYNALDKGISLKTLNGFLADRAGVFRYYNLKMSGINPVDTVFLSVYRGSLGFKVLERLDIGHYLLFDVLCVLIVWRSQIDAPYSSNLAPVD